MLHLDRVLGLEQDHFDRIKKGCPTIIDQLELTPNERMVVEAAFVTMLHVGAECAKKLQQEIRRGGCVPACDKMFTITLSDLSKKTAKRFGSRPTALAKKLLEGELNEE